MAQRDTRSDHGGRRRPAPPPERSDGGARPGGRLTALQRAAGNAAVSTLLAADGADRLDGHEGGVERRVVTERHSFHATVAKEPQPAPMGGAPQPAPMGGAPQPAPVSGAPAPAARVAAERDGRGGAGAGGPVLPPLPETPGPTGDTLAAAAAAVGTAVSDATGAAVGAAAGIAGWLAGAGGGAAPPGGAPAADDLPRTVALPDIVIPGLALVAEVDKPVGGTLAYTPTVTKAAGNPGPDEFGATSPYDFRMTGLTVTESAAAFAVAGTVHNPITYQIAAPTGPGGEKDIDADTSPTIKRGNYVAVANALKPDMSDLNGRPPRVGYYAKDLTDRHERFHATDGQTHARSGVQLAQAWLGTQRAADIAGVQALVATVPNRVIATRQAAMTFPGREERAYGDGAPSYRARSDAIRTKGAAGSYPA